MISVHPVYVIIGLLAILILVAALCGLSYSIGWKEGRRRWLRNRTQQEIDLTEELRQRELRRHRV